MDTLLEFRAGLAILASGEVTPEHRKGMVRVAVIEELLHFQWLNREGKKAVEPPELDIVIFPEEADVTRVTNIRQLAVIRLSQSLRIAVDLCNGLQDVQPGLRYLHLKFRDPSRQGYFFWWVQLLLPIGYQYSLKLAAACIIDSLTLTYGSLY